MLLVISCICIMSVLGSQKQGAILMSNVNDQLHSKFLSLVADMQRLSESEVFVVTGILKQLERDLVSDLMDNPDVSQYSKRRYTELLNRNKKAIDSAYEDISSHGHGFLLTVAALSQAGIRKTFSDVGIVLPGADLTSKQINSIVSSAYIEGATHSNWWEVQSVNMQNAFITQMNLGYASKENISQLVQRIRGTSTGIRTAYLIDGEKKYYTQFSGGILGKGRNQAATLMRTEVLQISADVRHKILENNSELFRGIIWSAVLDSRTTLLCASRSGKLYTLDGKPVGHNLPYLRGPGKAHWGCRSCAIAVVKSREELERITGFEKFLSKDSSVVLQGNIPREPSFEEWLRALPEKEQVSYLGERRYAIWKDKGLTLAQLTDQRGNPLTVNQLADMYGYKLDSRLSLGVPEKLSSTFPAVGQGVDAVRAVTDLVSNNPTAKALLRKVVPSGVVSSGDAVALAAYLMLTLDGEEEAKRSIIGIRERVNGGLRDLEETSSSEYIRLKEEAAALRIAEKSRSDLDSERMVIYESQLSAIREENAELEKRLLSVVNSDKRLQSLFSKFKTTASYRLWDMQYTMDKFRRYVSNFESGTKILHKIAQL